MFEARESSRVAGESPRATWETTQVGAMNFAQAPSKQAPTQKDAKRQNGQYFTRRNPFEHAAFLAWAAGANIPDAPILEPFAGENSLIEYLQHMGLADQFVSYDIAPANPDVQPRDTLDSFPKGHSVCVTNPPWLAKNSATVRGLPFPDCEFDDIYKFALSKCLQNCDWVAALIPESFIRANLFRDRLSDFVSLTDALFVDTDHPVGLALFAPDPVADTKLWLGGQEVGNLNDLESLRPVPRSGGPAIKFNAPDGQVGLFAVDNVHAESIRFCDSKELAGYDVKETCRYITRIEVDGDLNITGWNEFLGDFRRDTKDLLMTSCKGRRKDGMYRRRCDWALARGIIHAV